MKNIRRFTFSALTALVTAANAVALTASAAASTDMFDFPMSLDWQMWRPEEMNGVYPPADCIVTGGLYAVCTVNDEMPGGAHFTNTGFDLPYDSLKYEFTGVFRYRGLKDYFPDRDDLLVQYDEFGTCELVKSAAGKLTEEEARALIAMLPDEKQDAAGLFYRVLSEPKFADLNGDGNVMADDAMLVLREYVSGLANKAPTFTREQMFRANVNNDSQIGADDAQLILKYYADVLALKTA